MQASFIGLGAAGARAARGKEEGDGGGGRGGWGLGGLGAGGGGDLSQTPPAASVVHGPREAECAVTVPELLSASTAAAAVVPRQPAPPRSLSHLSLFLSSPLSTLFPHSLSPEPPAAHARPTLSLLEIRFQLLSLLRDVWFLPAACAGSCGRLSAVSCSFWSSVELKLGLRKKC